MAFSAISAVRPDGMLKLGYQLLFKDRIDDRRGKFYERFLNLLNGGGDFTDKVLKHLPRGRCVKKCLYEHKGDSKSFWYQKT